MSIVSDRMPPPQWLQPSTYGGPKAFLRLDPELPWPLVTIPLPRLLEQSPRTDIQQLVWRLGDEEPLVGIGWCLDAFVSLADADEDAIRDFARRFGPLLGSIPTEISSMRQRTHGEVVSLWRALARSLLSLLTLASDVLAERPSDKSAWLEALLLPKVVRELRNSERDWDELSQQMRSFVGGIGIPVTHAEQIAVVRTIANDLLALARVRADSGFGERGASGTAYVLPGYPQAHVRASSRMPYPVVDGLLPVLALQAAGTMRDNRVTYCDGCQRRIPLPQGAPRPRRGIPFYGNHDECRRQARLRSKSESQKKRYRRLRDAAKEQMDAREKPEDGRFEIDLLTE